MKYTAETYFQDMEALKIHQDRYDAQKAQEAEEKHQLCIQEIKESIRRDNQARVLSRAFFILLIGGFIYFLVSSPPLPKGSMYIFGANPGIAVPMPY